MVKLIVLAMFIGSASNTSQGFLAAVTLKDLTVPEERLPAGCALSPADSVRLNGNRFRGGLWAGLRIPTNPWAGSDAPTIATIRERIGGSTLMPDIVPPLTASESARYRLLLADGIDEAYAAIYLQSESSDLIVVYGLRFHEAKEAADFLSHAQVSKNPKALAAAIGPIIVVVSGDDGQCFQAVGAHLKSLAR